MSTTNFPNGVKTFPRSTASELVKLADYTVLAADCLGSTIIMNSSSAKTFVLPALTTVVGGIVTLVNGVDGQLLTIDPNAADGIAFATDVTNGKTIVNTAATAKKGDFVTLIAVGAVATGVAENWTVAAIGGVWADGA